MRFFNKQAQPVNTEINYQDVVDYLRDLSQQDYTKILKVVKLYRDADKGVKKVLGIKETPALDDMPMEDLLSDDDTSIGNFLEDEPPKPPKKAKAKK